MYVYPLSAECSITVIPTLEKKAIEIDCDSDGSDREHLAETGHLPGRLLDGDAKVNYLEDVADVHVNQVVCLPSPPFHCPLMQQLVLTQTHYHCHNLASLPQQPAEKGDAQMKKNHHTTKIFKISKIAAGFLKDQNDKIPDIMTYGPAVVECIQKTEPYPVDLFLLMFPPTLRDTVEMSNTYSMQEDT